MPVRVLVACAAIKTAVHTQASTWQQAGCAIFIAIFLLCHVTPTSAFAPKRCTSHLQKFDLDNNKQV
jgi:hypothetical protein